MPQNPILNNIRPLHEVWPGWRRGRLGSGLGAGLRPGAQEAMEHDTLDRFRVSGLGLVVGIACGRLRN